ncbi:unnamed protein product, partial [Meganyctiphanes norvegica]
MELVLQDFISVLCRQTVFQIQCFEASGRDLYLGSDDSVVVRYAVEEQHTDQGKILYSTNKICQKNLSSKKSIVQIKCASALGRLMVLSDGNLFLLDSDVLNTIDGAKIKNVTVFCINENPNTLDPFTIHLCVGKKRSIQVCSLHEDRVSLLKEVSTQDTPVNVAMDGAFVCVAGQVQYSIYNVETNSSQDLFPYDPETTYPHVKRVAKEEFLLAGPGNLGMFVTSAGISERPPIQWSDGVSAVSYYHPYILTINNQFIRVYSLIDQQHKQTINFSGGVLLGNFDGQVYIAGNSCVYCLMPQPWTSQVQALMEGERVEEAVELAEHSGATGMSQEQYQQFWRLLLQRSGFIKLTHGFYSQAQEYFIRGNVDLREVISLYPGLLPSSSGFVRNQPPLHHMADINQAMQGDTEKVNDAKYFLSGFLIQCRNSGQPIVHRLEMDTAIIKLYAEQQPEELLAFLESGDIVCALDECVSWLEKYNRYTAVAKLYRVLGSLDKSLSVLSRLVRDEVKDEYFGGLSDLVDVVIMCTDANVLWRYAEFVLDRNAEQGVRVFIETKAQVEPPKVLQAFQRHPKARLQYLHHLIDTQNFQDETYHTELVLHYVDQAVSLSTSDEKSDDDTENLEDVRNKLQDLLTSSSLYKSQAVLTRLHGTKLYVETASVYGRLGEHEKALSLLVHHLKDFSAAEQYCIAQTKRASSDQDKPDIFLTLLKIYLQPPPGGNADDIELAPALELLAQHAEQMDLSAVLALLPQHWSLSILQQYLRQALRASLHQSRIKRLQQTLARSENLQQKFILHKLSRDMGPIPVSNARICMVCGKNFSTSEFTIYPNGVMTHKTCAADPHVCPLTGTVFLSVK